MSVLDRPPQTAPNAEALLAPHMLGQLTLRNRLAVAPMTRVTATPDGFPTEAMARYYEGFAKGGFGLVISEGLYTDTAFAQGYLNQPGLADDRQARAWAPITAVVQANGARMVAQLMHAGALRQGNRFRDHAVAPSAIQPKGQQMAFYYGQGAYALPRQITEEEIEDAIAGFAQSARRAVEIAGFDAIEIHGANGYLLDQFLTADTNQRTDHWGGGVNERTRLLVAVVQRVKEAVAGRAPVGIRISQGKVNDFHAKWGGGEGDAKVVFEALADAGVDFLHVTEFQAWQPAFEGNTATLANLAKRHAPAVPLIVNGSLHEQGRASAALHAGADIVAMGRGALVNPDMPRLLQRGLPLREFDNAILGPIADIKQSELALRAQSVSG
ncbi:NADH:flavin oxidoreductase [Pseudoxanthomonas sp. SL93]|uniref:NADH:flavin oxidoreductase n=1 Tax=Pseudoxanthomonas sp. SL93 TaxID=2995142 RepID=UPI00226E8FAE|nr:NADH:flavin oxidoreductase [Pseudoxanthomonas sp. SL93]WAC62493.1 NADH:flavin oxidoreductase [Pseudoxanthomonas sp. SL93]